MKRFYNSPEVELNYINSAECITASGDRAYDENSNDQDVEAGAWAN